jgi:hypothetical protein
VSLHAEHRCRICDTGCLWCKHCGYAHCFNGHEHEGFDGPAPPLDDEDGGRRGD